MNKIKYDIVIIGAGPAGCIAAREAKMLDSDLNVLLLEEHYNIGEPMQCAGLISVDGFKKLNLKIPKSCILNTVRGAIFYAPNSTSFKIKSKKEMARVIDRRIFDKYLAELAIKEGVKLELGHKVTDIDYSNKNMKNFVKLSIKTDDKKEDIYTKIIIDAEGIKGKLLKQCGFSPPKKTLPAIQLEMSNVNIEDSEVVELFFGKNISPGFFAYFIPTSENSARIEVASKRNNTYNYLVHFLKKHSVIKDRIKNANILEVLGGSIITGGPIKKTYSNNIMLVGDAAGQVKATTGGGVIMGGLCSKIAAKIAVESILKNDFSAKFLKKYDRLWRNNYEREFKIMNLTRNIINIMPDLMFNELFKTINDFSITKLIESYGDMDFQSEVIKKIIFSKKIPIMIMSLIFNLFRHLF